MSNNRETLDNKAGGDSKSRRRWLNIGPGVVIALAISGFIGSQWIRTEVSQRRQRSVPPIVERQVISSTHQEKSGPTPEVSFIIDRAASLHITDDQLVQLKVLHSEWQRLYGPKIAAANEAAAGTGKYLEGAERKPRVPVAQIQKAAGRVIALSGEISSARRTYWNRAIRILNAQQRKALQTEREATWAAGLKIPNHRLR